MDLHEGCKGKGGPKLSLLVEEHEGVQQWMEDLGQSFDTWWPGAEGLIDAVLGQDGLMAARSKMLGSLEDALVGKGLLDRFSVKAAGADWWDQIHIDLKVLTSRGYRGVVESWARSIETTVEEEGLKSASLAREFIGHLLPEYSADLRAAEAEAAQLADAINLAEAKWHHEAGDGSEAELVVKRRRRNAARRRVRDLEEDFMKRLAKAQGEIREEWAREVFLSTLRSKLEKEVRGEANKCVQAVVAVLEGWWDKYRTSLREIQDKRERAEARLFGELRSLGYLD